MKRAKTAKSLYNSSKTGVLLYNHFTAASNLGRAPATHRCHQLLELHNLMTSGQRDSTYGGKSEGDIANFHLRAQGLRIILIIPARINYNIHIDLHVCLRVDKDRPGGGKFSLPYRRRCLRISLTLELLIVCLKQDCKCCFTKLI